MRGPVLWRGTVGASKVVALAFVSRGRATSHTQGSSYSRASESAFWVPLDWIKCRGKAWGIRVLTVRSLGGAIKPLGSRFRWCPSLFLWTIKYQVSEPYHFPSAQRKPSLEMLVSVQSTALAVVSVHEGALQRARGLALRD